MPRFTAPAGVTARSSKARLEAFFHSPPLQALAGQVCEIGRRMWQRSYVDGNAGNIAIRVGEDIVLCTPTLVSKGFMQPKDLCLVDMAGSQLTGRLKRTSEVLLHLQMMQRQPRAVATVHCHPPYGTAMGVTGTLPPAGLVAEYETLLSVAIAPYSTPGSPEVGRGVAGLVDTHNVILMANHGVVAWSHNSVEDGYFKIEVLEAYCGTALIVQQLGRPPRPLTPRQVQELLKIKRDLGFPDPRHGTQESAV
jgi:L-fuculose-phosphate aldolase